MDGINTTFICLTSGNTTFYRKETSVKNGPPILVNVTLFPVVPPSPMSGQVDDFADSENEKGYRRKKGK